jgi:putative oxidoreductase
MFVYHGAPKMFGGAAVWLKLGATMKFLGIGFAPVFWGFMAAFAEFCGGAMLLAGFFFRPASFLLLSTMATAVAMKFGTGAGLAGAAHPLELGIVFLSLIFVGPGKYSLDHMLQGRFCKGQ